MTGLVSEKEVIPVDKYAKKGSHCDNVVIAKAFFYDGLKYYTILTVLEKAILVAAMINTLVPQQAVYFKSGPFQSLL